MIIRKLEPEDIPKAAAFENEISLISFGEEAIDDISFYIKKLTKCLTAKDNYMYVAEQDQDIVGWLWFARRSNFITNELYLDFKSFYLAEHCRKTELSDLLMDKLMEVSEAEHIGKIIGRVEAKNVEMRFLYKKYGFVPRHITMEYNESSKMLEKQIDEQPKPE